jgi:hypothetical protein
MNKMVVLLLVFMVVMPMSVTSAAQTDMIYSDTSLMVYGPLNHYRPIDSLEWDNPVPSVLTWPHPSWPTQPPANWISNTKYIEGNISGDTWRLFRKTVDLCEHAYNVSGTITANSDNAEEVYVNGVLLGFDGQVQLSQGQGGYIGDWRTFVDYDYQTSEDTLVFDFIVRNYSGGSSPTDNPTGLIFSASINYSCPLKVGIDIKPGSFPSCFNNNDNGLIPVAIFGSQTFDVHDVDVATVRLESLPVATKPNGRYMAAYEDWNSDGFMDLLVKFVDNQGVFDPADEFATLTGNLTDGTPFYGVGDVCIRVTPVPGPKK